MTAVIIYGPQESGKTRNAEALRKLFSKTQIIEADDVHPFGTRLRSFPSNALVLTNNEDLVEHQCKVNGAQRVDIGAALILIKCTTRPAPETAQVLSEADRETLSKALKWIGCTPTLADMATEMDAARDGVEAILTRASAATVAEPSTDRLAYEGAREDLLDWKRRALEADELNHKFIATVNGPTHIGEPVIVAQQQAELSDDRDEDSAFKAWREQQWSAGVDPTPRDTWMERARRERDLLASVATPAVDYVTQQQTEPVGDENAIDELLASIPEVSTAESAIPRDCGTYVEAAFRAIARKARAAQSGLQSGVAEDARAVADALEAEYLAVANGEKKPAKIALEPLVRAVEAIRKLTAAPTPAAQEQDEPRLSDAARDVFLERVRQQSEEGWTPEHDDEHQNGEIADAAGVYALHAGGHDMQMSDGLPSAYWPWDKKWWKPKDKRSNLVRAGALILAEIERLDRAAAPTPAAQGTTQRKESP